MSLLLKASPWRTVGDTRDRVGESPVWDGDGAALYWVDIEGRFIRRLDGRTGQVQSWPTAERVGCIALSDRGSVVAAMETGVFELQLGEPPASTARLLARARHPQAGMRFNDGRGDAQGRFWISSMCMDMSLAAPVGALQVLDERGLSEPRITGLITPNGLAFSADGTRAWLSDSHPSVQLIWTFARDAGTGALSARRPWVDMNPLPGRPDGAAVDAEGCYWICGNDAGQVHRFSADGLLMQSLTVPFAKPAMCCFGGDGLRTMFVTSIQPPASPAAMGLAGALLACEPGVAGLPEPRFTRFPAFPPPA